MSYVRPLDLKKERPRAVFSTTIDREVQDEFKNYCKVRSLPMNIVIEQFMKQFKEGEFDIKLKKKENGEKEAIIE